MHLEYCMYIILSNLFIPILGGSELDWNRLNNCLYLRISEFSGHFFDQVPSLVLLVLDKYPRVLTTNPLLSCSERKEWDVCLCTWRSEPDLIGVRRPGDLESRDWWMLNCILSGNVGTISCLAPKYSHNKSNSSLTNNFYFSRQWSRRWTSSALSLTSPTPLSR